MPTMTLKYACPSGYFSGASIPSKNVSRTGIGGAPSDSHTYYKITKWSASFQGQVYPSAGVNCNLFVAGNAFTISCGSSSSTKTYSGWGGGPFNTAILDSGQTGTLTVGVSRNSSGSGNALLIKSEITISIDYEYNFTPCSAPSNVWVDSSSVYVSGTTNLNWDGASAGKNMSISKYQIYRATTASGEYSHLADATGTKLSVSAPAAMGDSYYYKVKTVGSVEGYDSDLSSSYATLTAKTVSNCSAPSAISLSATTIDAGGTTKLTWSGAAAGTNNPITAFTIYYSTDNQNFNSYQIYTTSGTSGSINITLNPAADTTYYFMVITNGTIAGYNSGASAKVSVLVKTYTKCGNIPSASFPSNIAEGTALLTWSAAADGHNNPVSGYRIDYQDSADGSTYSAVKNLTTAAATATQYACAVNPNRGQYRRFMITAVGAKSGFDGNTTTTPAIKTNQLPVVPVINVPVSGKTCVSDMAMIGITLAAEKDGQAQKVVLLFDGTEHTPSNVLSANGQSFYLGLSNLTAGEHTLKVKAYDGLAYSAYTDEITFTYSPCSFTDSSPTTVKAAHINELRSYTNTLRDWYGKAVKEWSETITADKTTVKANHWKELQTAINEVVPHTFTKVEKNGQIKKKVLTELRNAIKEG